MDRLEELIARCKAVVNAPKGELPTPLIAHASDCALLLAALQALKSPWVEVGERLPEVECEVMVYRPNARSKRTIGILTLRVIWQSPVSNFSMGEVTHWSALPKPPGGVE